MLFMLTDARAAAGRRPAGATDPTCSAYFVDSSCRSGSHDGKPLAGEPQLPPSSTAVATAEGDELWPRARWWQRSGWEEAAVLLAGLYSDDCWPVIDWLKDAQPEVAARCLLESGAAPPDAQGRLALPDAWREALRAAWLPRLTDIEREPRPRLAPRWAVRWGCWTSTTGPE
jgi:hypothetical protein